MSSPSPLADLFLTMTLCSNYDFVSRGSRGTLNKKNLYYVTDYHRFVLPGGDEVRSGAILFFNPKTEKWEELYSQEELDHFALANGGTSEI